MAQAGECNELCAVEEGVDVSTQQRRDKARLSIPARVTLKTRHFVSLALHLHAQDNYWQGNAHVLYPHTHKISCFAAG